MKAREVEHYYKEYGAEKGSMLCLQQLAEQHSIIMQQVTELAQMQDRIINTLSDVVSGTLETRSQVERMRNMNPDGMGSVDD